VNFLLLLIELLLLDVTAEALQANINENQHLAPSGPVCPEAIRILGQVSFVFTIHMFDRQTDGQRDRHFAHG